MPIENDVPGARKGFAPLVSIVIPVFNGRDFIEEAIRSVLSQSYQNLECIVVDDGSRDGSGELALGFGEAVRVIRQQNQGQAAALNRGWREARGELIGYLSADDLLDSDAVTRLISAVEAEPVPAIVFPDYRLIDRSGRTIKTVSLEFRGYEWMLRKFECPIGPGALFHKGLLESKGGWKCELRQLPDFEFWIRAGRNAHFTHVREVLASFRVHQGSQTFAVADVSKANESVSVADEFSNTGELPADVANEFLASARVFSACLHLRSGRYVMGVRRIGEAFAERPSVVLSWRTARRLAGACLSRITYGYRA